MEKWHLPQKNGIFVMNHCLKSIFPFTAFTAPICGKSKMAFTAFTAGDETEGPCGKAVNGLALEALPTFTALFAADVGLPKRFTAKGARS